MDLEPGDAPMTHDGVVPDARAGVVAPTAGPSPTGAVLGDALVQRLSANTVVTVAVVLFLLLGLIVAIVATRPAATAGASVVHARTALRHALDTSLAKSSADVSATFTASVMGITASGSATGAFSIATHELTLTFKASALGHDVTGQVILDGSTLYAHTPLFADFGIKPWISVPIPAGATGSAGGFTISDIANPPALLQFLVSSGGTETDLGSSTVGGTAVDGYQVTFTGAQLAPSGGSATASAASARARLAALLKTATLAVDLYVATATGLLRKATVAAKDSVTLSSALSAVSSTSTGEHGAWHAMASTTHASAPSGKITVAANLTVNFTNWGTAVTVTAPTGSQVEPIQTVLKSFGGGHGSSKAGSKGGAWSGTPAFRSPPSTSAHGFIP